MPAITTGAGLGPVVNGQPTDIITMMMDDSVLGELAVYPPGGGPNGSARLAADGSSIDTSAQTAWLQGDPANGIPAIQVGDVLYFSSPTGTTLQTVTRILAPTIYFDVNDPFRFNQRSAAAGSITQILGSTMSVRRAVNHLPAQAMAGVVEKLLFSYDLVDGTNNPTAVKSVPYTANSVTYSASQIRKVNVQIGVRSEEQSTPQRQYLRKELSTVVSLRNLAYVSRYQ
jgi:hypothetical protein